MNNINLEYKGKQGSRHPDVHYHIFDGILNLLAQRQLEEWCERNLHGYFSWWSPFDEHQLSESFGELWIADDQDAATVRTFWQGNTIT